MITKNDIIQAYVNIRKLNNPIPDVVLDFMKNCAIEKINKSQLLPIGTKVELIESEGMGSYSNLKTEITGHIMYFGEMHYKTKLFGIFSIDDFKNTLRK